MNKLIAELQRLYLFPDQQWLAQKSSDSGSPTDPAAANVTADSVASRLEGVATGALNLVNADGMTRAMIVRFEKATDWEQVARLCRGVQEELDLPASAVSVSGKDGYQVWFSLAESVPVDHARIFLNGLRRRYLSETPVADLTFCPGTGESPSAAQSVVDLVPAIHRVSGKWSAFIDPRLGRMFMEEPGLDMAPNLDRQADLLAQFDSIKAGDFQRVLNILAPHAELDSNPAEQSATLPREAANQPGPPVVGPRSTLSVGSNFSDPRSFLLAVMNAPSASARQRIRAAKALLPYFEKVPPK